MIKRVVISILTLMILMGCATKKLYEPKSYSEKVSSIYYSEDKSKLVVFTDKYHYAFNAPKQLIDALSSEYATKLTAFIHDFHVTKENIIAGKVYLFLKGDGMGLGYNEGFRKLRKGVDRVQFDLEGVRYSSGGVAPPQSQHSLNKEYIIRVTTEDVNLVTAAILTPFIIAQDVVTLGLGVVLAPVAMPLFVWTAQK